jgi:ABC-2 type transport system ATP-binding protein
MSKPVNNNDRPRMSTILEVINLVKEYPAVKAVDNVSFAIETGTCFGLLGPNGAGKTTTLEIIEGIIRPTSGEVKYKDAPIGKQFKQEAGFLFQSTALQEFLTVEETLQLFERLYEKTLPLEKLIDMCSLDDILKRDNRKLSGGQRQRMLLAIALINDPEIVFLDEPTTGLDPQARRNFWELIDSIKAQNKTIILTTHYMDEAEYLCDIVAIMDQGRIIEKDTPDVLLKSHFGDVVLEIPVVDIPEIGQLKDLIYAEKNSHFIIQTDNVHDTIIRLNELDANLEHMQVRNRTLEDLFLKITGSDLRV